jgi:hypothetical protein
MPLVKVAPPKLTMLIERSCYRTSDNDRADLVSPIPCGPKDA